MAGLSREATARNVSMDMLAEILLRSIIQDKLFDAVIDDENRLPRRHRVDRRRSGVRRTIEERRVKILETIDQSANGRITIQQLGDYAHLWIKAIKSLVDEGKVKAERMRAAGNYTRIYYSRNA